MEKHPPEAIERLLVLAEQEVWVSIVRASGPSGAAVVRRGVLRVAATADEIRTANRARYEVVVARVLDEAGAPIAVLTSYAVMHDWNGVLRFEPRLFFSVEISEREPPGLPPDHALIAPKDFARGLIAELEASLGHSMMLDPDPDAEASWKALYKKFFPIQVVEFSTPSKMQISANMRGAFISWADDSLDASYYAPALQPNGELMVEVLSPRGGSQYDYSERELHRLGADLRRHFHGQTDHLVRRGR